MTEPGAEHDHVDGMRAQWTRETPAIDTAPMAIIGRARRITLALRPAIEAVFARHGLDSGEFDVLTSLRRAGPPFRMRPTDLFRALMVSSGGMSDRLARLERAGLIARLTDPDDGRGALVELTGAGRLRIEAAFAEDMALEARLLAGLTADERAALAALLRRLALSVGA